MTETDLCEPQSVYAIAKLAATLYAQRAAKIKKIPVTTLRLFSPYGPQDNEKRLIPQVISKLSAGEQIHVANPGHVRDFVYIDDVVDAYIISVKKSNRLSGQIINIGTGTQTTIRKVVKLIGSHFKSENSILWHKGDELRYESPVWKANNDKAKRLLGWQPKIDLEEGIKRTIMLRNRKLQ
jgi:nucleoside-diphosphate-sugar epimerase